MNKGKHTGRETAARFVFEIHIVWLIVFQFRKTHPPRCTYIYIYIFWLMHQQISTKHVNYERYLCVWEPIDITIAVSIIAFPRLFFTVHRCLHRSKETFTEQCKSENFKAIEKPAQSPRTTSYRSNEATFFRNTKEPRAPNKNTDSSIFSYSFLKKMNDTSGYIPFFISVSIAFGQLNANPDEVENSKIIYASKIIKITHQLTGQRVWIYPGVYSAIIKNTRENGTRHTAPAYIIPKQLTPSLSSYIYMCDGDVFLSPAPAFILEGARTGRLYIYMYMRGSTEYSNIERARTPYSQLQRDALSLCDDLHFLRHIKFRFRSSDALSCWA